MTSHNEPRLSSFMPLPSTKVEFSPTGHRLGIPIGNDSAYPSSLSSLEEEFMKMTNQKMAEYLDEKTLESIALLNTKEQMKATAPPQATSGMSEQHAILNASVETLISAILVKLNRQPTSAAIMRVLDFANTSSTAFRDLVPNDGSAFSKESQELVDVLQSIPLVRRVRVIGSSFPETLELSVQIDHSGQSEEELESQMEYLHHISQTMKPAGLIELEISLTNRVVF